MNPKETVILNNDMKLNLKEAILLVQQWLIYLLSKWLILLIAIAIGGVVGFFIEYIKKPSYTAELTFVLNGGKQGGGMAGYAGLASQLGIDMGSSGGGVFEGQNLLALMKSRLMIQKTLLTQVTIDGKVQTLADYYIEISGLRKRWVRENSSLKDIKFLKDADPAKFSLEQNQLISSFHNAIVDKNLFVDNKDKKSTIIAMRVSSNDELFSKYFTEALAKEVSDFYVATKIKKSINNLVVLQYQADSVRKEYNNAISNMASSIDANPNPNFARQSLRVPSQSREVDAAANQAMLIELMKNLAISQISLREETPLIQIIDTPVLPLPIALPNPVRGFILGCTLLGLLTTITLIVAKMIKSSLN